LSGCNQYDNIRESTKKGHKKETTMNYTIQQYNMIADEFEMLGDFHTIGTETGVFLAYKGERLSGAYENLYEAMIDAVENAEEIIEYHESTKQGPFSAPQTKAQPKKKQKALKYPGYLCMQLVVKPERKVVLTYFGNKVSFKEAKSIIDFLFTVHCSSQYKKPLGHQFDCDDVYPNIKKMIADGSLTIEQAKDICMKHCSEYVFQTKIAA
jgi:hypothetical protein